MSDWNILSKPVSVNLFTEKEKHTFTISKDRWSNLKIEFYIDGKFIKILSFTNDDFFKNNESDNFLDIIFGNKDLNIDGILSCYYKDSIIVQPFFILLVSIFILNPSDIKLQNFFLNFKDSNEFIMHGGGRSVIFDGKQYNINSNIRGLINLVDYLTEDIYAANI